MSELKSFIALGSSGACDVLGFGIHGCLGSLDGHHSQSLHRVKNSDHNTIRALIIRIGFWGPLCYNYKKEPPK